MASLTVGIDLAKNVFSLHGVDAHGKVALRKTVKRNKLMQSFANLPKDTLIGMEACSSAHYWARQLQKLGYTARIMASRFVMPYRKGGKNDSNDAEAICEAVGRPNMRFVSIKSPDQQSALCVHRLRQGLVRARTAQINQLRGLLMEFGIVVRKNRESVQREVPLILEDAENELPWVMRKLIEGAFTRLLQRVCCLINVTKGCVQPDIRNGSSLTRIHPNILLNRQELLKSAAWMHLALSNAFLNDTFVA